MSARPDFLDLTFPALEDAMSGVSPVHARVLWRAVHRSVAEKLIAGPDFQGPLRRWLAATPFELGALRVVREIQSADGRTRKFLSELIDGSRVETVLMEYPGRHTACLSTQVGCAMGCVFCATGQAGFTRHLTAGEMVAQVRLAERTLREAGKPGLRNLVMMGMGEPLHNYEAVLRALEIVTDPRGMNLGPTHISISTVGVVPGILRLASETQPYNLAVSLHGSTEKERRALVPVSRRWPLAELIEACREYTRRTRRRIFFEWTLIAGKNDTPAQAERLAVLLKGIPAHVNLIPLNPTAGFAGQATARAEAAAFQTVLRAAGVPSTVRQRRGIDVAAGCGQLRATSSE